MVGEFIREVVLPIVGSIYGTAHERSVYSRLSLLEQMLYRMSWPSSLTQLKIQDPNVISQSPSPGELRKSEAVQELMEMKGTWVHDSLYDTVEFRSSLRDAKFAGEVLADPKRCMFSLA